MNSPEPWALSSESCTEQSKHAPAQSSRPRAQSRENNPDLSDPFDRFLQNQRFGQIIPYLKGDVIDFGGNRGELKPHVKGRYTLINHDHSLLPTLTADTITALAVIEHLEPTDVTKVFTTFASILRPSGLIVVTTPSILAQPILETLAAFRLIDKSSIDEHKHYWSKQDLLTLATRSNLILTEYKTFQFGLNQLAVFKGNPACNQP